jgi:hypothetical protein
MTAVAPQASGQEQELVAGTIQGITQKGADKWQVAVLPDGSQYTRNLWSSDPGLISQLSALIGTRQTFLCRVSNWTATDGGARRSLWILGTGPQGVVPQPTPQPAQPVYQPQPVPQPVPQPPTVVQPQVVTRVPEEERESRIMRQTASKVGAILISHLPLEQRTFDNLLRISENLVGYYRFGFGQTQGAANPGDGDPGPQGIPHDDDDVPF